MLGGTARGTSRGTRGNDMKGCGLGRTRGRLRVLGPAGLWVGIAALFGGVAGGACATDPLEGGPTALRAVAGGGLAAGPNEVGSPVPQRLQRAAPPPGARDECHPSGDPSGDGAVTATDAQLAFGIALGFVAAPPEQRCAADCNGDGRVTAGDAQDIFATAFGVGRCPHDLPRGAACAADAECQSGDCRAGVCCVPGFAGPACDVCVRYVTPAAAAPTPDGLTWETAFRTVQPGLDAARAAVDAGLAARCEVWTAAGTYRICTSATPTATVALRPAVDLYGGFAGTEETRAARDVAAHPTVLDGFGRCAHVVTGADDARLDGFTVTRGAGAYSPSDSRGAGMLNDGVSPTVANCTFTEHTLFSMDDGIPATGAALYNRANAPTIVGCTFRGNLIVGHAPEVEVGLGAAMYNEDSAPVIANCTFSGNVADAHNGPGGKGGALFNRDSAVTLTNVVFHDNLAIGSGDVAFSRGSDVTLTNVTVHQPPVYGALVHDAGELTVTNSILWGGGLQIVLENGATAAVTYSDVAGGYAGVGNLDLDPRFVGPEDADYRLAADSPGLDAADGTAAPPTDFSGQPRFDQPAVPDTGAGSPPYADLGAFERTLVTDCATPCRRYVDVDSTVPQPDGLAWETAFSDVRAGVDAARAAILAGSACRCDVWVAAGTYGLCTAATRQNGLRLRRGVHVYGGFAGTENDLAERDWLAHATALDGQNWCYHVVYGADEATLDGFTVLRGNAIGDENDQGAGLYGPQRSPTVSNCVFRDNVATGGGAMYLSASTATLTGCTFEHNTAQPGNGGAVLLSYSQVSIRDSVFRENQAARMGGALVEDGCAGLVSACRFERNTAALDGGAVSAGASNSLYVNDVFVGNGALGGGGGAVQVGYFATPTFVNCTFNGNTATGGGGAFFVSSSAALASVVNGILWGNTSPEIRLQYSGEAAVAFSDVQGGYPGPANLDVDPLFVDVPGGDLRLLPASPCIDRADGALAPPVDFAGAPRYDDPAHPNLGSGAPDYADLGAFEFQGADRR